MRLSDAIRRGIRTFVQAFIGVILAQSGAILFAAQKGEYVLDIEWWKRIAVSGAAAGVIALFSYIQNALEDRGTVPALLKAPPSPGANPVPDDAGPAMP